MLDLNVDLNAARPEPSEECSTEQLRAFCNSLRGEVRSSLWNELDGLCFLIDPVPSAGSEKLRLPLKHLSVARSTLHAAVCELEDGIGKEIGYVKTFFLRQLAGATATFSSVSPSTATGGT